MTSLWLGQYPGTLLCEDDVAEVRLTDEEAQALRRALQVFAVRTRTGELGIIHGLDRFVSTQSIFKRSDLANLDSAARKLGLGGVRRTDK